MSVPGYLERMLRLAHQCDVREQLDWTLNLGGDEIIFVVECAELFLEREYETVPVTPEDVDAFEKALRDVSEATGGDFTFGPSLYACRVRGRRPCNVGYPTDVRLHPLFESIVAPILPPEPAGRHQATVTAHIPGATPGTAPTTRTFVFPADRFIVSSTTGNGIHAPAGPGVDTGEPFVDTDLSKNVGEGRDESRDEGPTADLKVDGQVLTAGDGWPALTLGGHVEPPPHPCAPHSTGGPDHCGLCGRTWTPREVELAAQEAKRVSAGAGGE